MMKKLDNFHEINEDVIRQIQGGSFGYDVGWFLGNSIAGNFFSIAGTADAFFDYALHYSSEENK